MHKPEKLINNIKKGQHKFPFNLTHLYKDREDLR